VLERASFCKAFQSISHLAQRISCDGRPTWTAAAAVPLSARSGLAAEAL